MNVEMQLLSFLVALGTLDPAIQWGISSEDFLTASARQLWEYLVQYSTAIHHAGALPGFNNLAQKFTSFQKCHDDTMTVEALCLEVRQHRVKQETRKLMQDVEMRLVTEVSPMDAMVYLQERVALLSTLTAGTSAATFSSAVKGTLLRYMERANGIFRCAVKYPWDELNAITNGIEPSDYVLYYGRPKNKKTFVMLYHLMHVFKVQRKRVLLYSKEMPQHQIWDRCLCFWASVPYDLFRAGKCSPDQLFELQMAEMEIEDIREETNGRADIICLSGQEAPEGGDNVQWLQAMAKRYAVDVIFIDGVYLMASHIKAKDAHARAEAISRAVRNMTLRLGIPAICTIQANRGADKTGLTADMDEISFSDAFGQDTTAAYRVVADKLLPTINVLLPGSREFKLHGFQIHGIPCTNFGWIKRLDADEVATATSMDDAAAALMTGQAAKGRGKKRASGLEVPTAPTVEDMLEGL